MKLSYSNTPSPSLYPASRSVTASGNTAIAPCGTASFCFPGALQNKLENSGKERRSNFFRPAPNKALLGSWEHRPTSLISDPSKIGNSKRRHNIMYKNKTELMGFLGGDAAVHTDKNDKPFTTLRLATTKSRKNKQTGKYVERTEWHNLVVFGKLSEFAAKLKKGAHIEIEGKLQYSEYKGVTTASIRVYSILKLDRAEKATPEDDFDEVPEGEACALSHLQLPRKRARRKPGFFSC